MGNIILLIRAVEETPEKGMKDEKYTVWEKDEE